MKNDFIEYPMRTQERDLLCKCMHKKSSHHLPFSDDNESCMTCMCKGFDLSAMNDNILTEVEEAMKKAQPKLNINSTNKYHNGIRKKNGELRKVG